MQGNTRQANQAVIYFATLCCAIQCCVVPGYSITGANKRLADCSKASVCYVSALIAVIDDLTHQIYTIISDLHELTLP